MALKRAKTLTSDQLDNLLDYVRESSRTPVRDRLMILLSHKAGLRAAEIAKIEVDAMTDSEGKIAKEIRIFSNVGKKKRERVIPMHPQIARALHDFRFDYPHATKIAFSPRNTRKYLTPNALTVWFWRLYCSAGFTGCSSHTGRRSFGTTLARSANNFHNSLRDVQLLLGHARLDTTEAYIEPSEDVSNMVFSM
jgi:integrase